MANRREEERAAERKPKPKRRCPPLPGEASANIAFQKGIEPIDSAEFAEEVVRFKSEERARREGLTLGATGGTLPE